MRAKRTNAARAVKSVFGDDDIDIAAAAVPGYMRRSDTRISTVAAAVAAMLIVICPPHARNSLAATLSLRSNTHLCTCVLIYGARAGEG